jgi:hypothetical protein
MLNLAVQNQLKKFDENRMLYIFLNAVPNSEPIGARDKFNLACPSVKKTSLFSSGPRSARIRYFWAFRIRNRNSILRIRILPILYISVRKLYRVFDNSVQ